MEKIIIYLHADSPSWVYAENAHHQQSVLHGDASLLAELCKDKQVIVIVPAEDVLLTTTNLPKMRASRLRQALPYAVEEQLIDDVDELHFAMGEYQADDVLPVAVVSRKKMAAWLSILQEWNVQADLLLPASLALPFVAEQWQIFFTDEISIVRTGIFQGFACDKENLTVLLNAALVKELQKPTLIRIYNYTKNSALPLLVTSVQCQEEFHPPLQLLEGLARGTFTTPQLNLLQGVYAQKKDLFAFLQAKKLWLTAGACVAVWIFILFFSPLGSYFILHNRLSGIEADIQQIYKNNFPQASSVVAPKVRMEEKLKKLQGHGGDSQLLQLLAYVGQGMTKVPGVRLQRVDFQSNQLSLEMIADSSEGISAFTTFLTQQGLNVMQRNVTLLDDKMRATLSVE